MRAAKILLVLVGALVALAAVVRVGAGVVVGLADFPSFAASELARFVNRTVPGTLVTVRGSRLAGLCTLVLDGVEIRNEAKVEAPLLIRSIATEVAPSSLFRRGGTDFDVDFDVLPKGRVHLVASLPLAYVIFGTHKSGDELRLRGEVNSLNTMAFGDLLAPGSKAVPFRMVRGAVEGTLNFASRWSVEDGAEHRDGRAEFVVDDLVWEIAEEKADGLAIPTEVGLKTNFAFDSTKIVLDLRDGIVSLAAPVLFASQKHRASMVGGLALPWHDHRALNWNLEVTSAGSPAFAAALSRILRCKSPPAAEHFLVTGPMTAARCVRSE